MDDALPNPSPWPRRLRWLFGIVAALMLIAAIAYAAFMYLLLSSFKGPYDGRNRITFTREAWLAAEHDWDGARYLMLDDLLATESLEGQSRSEIESFLGPLIPPTEYPGGEWCYFLGPEPSWVTLDNIWLAIEFDDSDHVLTTRTFTD
ncbi:MAG TPA: hypothetical protein VK843_14195 [Planctomycetota bacterium]|nr:hypothetical protein [Planctomycetota bacterium]